ncbi:hypothetical protein DDB_G0273295 [Dictyostelium discoideum AX4]|uniref:50S ribosomal protein L20 n=1 Tax=Dictyostelium discoideum TaxID=44689 RepID=Q556W7_DICDI|nr:hypothetical protein DDB_G0273771 [Dictyostelium discoideum AX4]XP_644748.1 hypothetical protein DDB_G0273295 [Dictyostelium discoideum AX4]EAL70576.1 hypothetical protein DDB_G0273771 [Dictyostelium discoideum AX4]EAL70865.1 hypothetical protein DDB_G0273295 [Dictyostelium discoideum AX4]|eukprot:XP_644502.1 hypothetical protein DDB_G0273771 [Dictyostelium discoideum AX4]
MNIDKVFKLAKGFFGRSKNCKSLARERVEKGLEYNYVSRKLKKRDFRKMWIERINAGARQHEMTYSDFQRGLIASGVEINRKILSELAVSEPFSFKVLVDHSKNTVSNLHPKSYIPLDQPKN